MLNELVNSRTNALVNSSGLLAVGLLNTDGEPVVSAGDTNLLSREILAEREHWSDNYVTFVLPVEGASVNPEGATNNRHRRPAVVPQLDQRRAAQRTGFSAPRAAPGRNQCHQRRRIFARQFSAAHQRRGEIEPPPPPDDGNRPPEGGDRPRGGHRPPWMRWMSEADFKALVAKRELHGLVLAMSTENYRAVCTHDLVAALHHRLFRRHFRARRRPGLAQHRPRRPICKSASCARAN